MKRNRVFISFSLIVLFSMLVGLTASTAQIPWAASQPNSNPGVPGWNQVNIDGFGNPATDGVSALENFNGQLYAGATSFTEGGQIWRTSNGTDWIPVSEVGFTSTMTTTNLAIIDLIVFKDHLYASTGWDTSTGQIWRSSSGTEWEQVVGDGFGNPNNVGITTFTVFSDTLFAAAGNPIDGLEVWRSPNGDSLSWTPVITSGLGYTGNQNVTGYTLYDNFLYIATEGNQSDEPSQIWRSADGTTWLPITLNGFGDLNNISMGGWAILNNDLYIGTRNNVTGAQLWRFNEADGWEPVINDGFGDVNNVKIESLYTFEGFLYAATNNNVSGMEVLRSSDGLSWRQINPDGFGDPASFATLWSNATIAFKNHLYMGDWNSQTGGEIWEYIGFPTYLPLLER